MYTDPVGPESVPESTQRNLTGLGLLCFLVLVALGFRYDLLLRAFRIHPAVSVSAVFVLAALVLLALYGLGNSWRLLNRGRRGKNGQSCDNIDLGWGGAMGTIWNRKMTPPAIQEEGSRARQTVGGQQVRPGSSQYLLWHAGRRRQHRWRGRFGRRLAPRSLPQ